MVFFSLSAELGLSTWGAREIARNTRRAGALLRDAAILRLVLAIAASLAMGGLALVVPKAAGIKLCWFSMRSVCSPRRPCSIGISKDTSRCASWPWCRSSVRGRSPP